MSKKEIIIILVMVIATGLIVVLATRSQNKTISYDFGEANDQPASQNCSEPQEQNNESNQNEDLSGEENMIDELKIETITQGEGAEVVSGDKVTVHYTGLLLDGTKFDSSLDRGTPFSFNNGEGQVISGWEKGTLGMKVGEKRKLTIPHDMAYGENGIPGVIPPKATLVFEIELLAIN
jgi:FKBP-type peptidyl-prolyl cis-trans isomerase